MSGEWEEYVGGAARAGHDAFFATERYGDDGELLPVKRRDVWRSVAEAVLAEVGPRIAEDTRERMVAAAARAMEREQTTAVSEVHKPFPDDGVTYCGWSTGSEIVDGCGEVYPCSTIRNRQNVDLSAELDKMADEDDE